MELPLETIINSLEDSIISVNREGEVVFLNEAAAKTFGCERTVPPIRPKDLPPALAQVLAELKLHESANHPCAKVCRFQVGNAAGEAVPMQALVSQTSLNGRTFCTAVIRDMSLHEQMEKTIYQSRKTQAVGALAGGIAHDFNNILTAVLSHADLAVSSGECSPSVREHLHYVQTSASRGAELVSKLLAFSGRAKGKPEPTDIADLIDQVVFVLRRSIDRRIQVAWAEPRQGSWLVHADANQIMEAIVNLALNARDAMPAGGRLSIDLEGSAFTEEDIRPPRKAGEFLRLTVTDTGAGMSGETLQRVFEPYFSTKDFSKGAGLGLSIASSVIGEHGGWMEVESQPNQGTRVHVFLPRSREPAAGRPARSAVSDSKALEGTERILVVDDEEQIRMVIRAVLSYRGYQVMEAQDGEDAINKYLAEPQNFHLILIDLHMPKLNGREALARIRQRHPQARAILLSGGVQERESESSPELKGVQFLPKPFDNIELLRTVRQILDARTEDAK